MQTEFGTLVTSYKSEALDAYNRLADVSVTPDQSESFLQPILRAAGGTGGSSTSGFSMA